MKYPKLPFCFHKWIRDGRVLLDEVELQPAAGVDTRGFTPQAQTATFHLWKEPKICGL